MIGVPREVNPMRSLITRTVFPLMLAASIAGGQSRAMTIPEENRNADVDRALEMLVAALDATTSTECSPHLTRSGPYLGACGLANEQLRNDPARVRRIIEAVLVRYSHASVSETEEVWKRRDNESVAVFGLSGLKIDVAFNHETVRFAFLYYPDGRACIPQELQPSEPDVDPSEAGEFVSASVEDKVPPGFPPMARELDAPYADVIVGARVEIDGSVSHACVGLTTSKNPMFGYEIAALEAINKWRFKPATRGGTPVPSLVSIPVRYRPRRID